MKRRVFIIGSGPSLEGFDFNLLKHEDTIAVNYAAQNVPFPPTYFLTADSGVIKKASDANFWGMEDTVKVVVMGPEHPNYRRVRNILSRYDEVILPARFDGYIGFDYDHFATGKNTGFCALQYAILLGYQEIYLLGFDLGLRGQQKYFYHKNPANPSPFNTFLKHFIDGFKRIQSESRIIVKYCSRPSRLGAYLKYVPVEKVIRGSMPVFISHYTKDTPYALVVKSLIKSLKKHKLDFDIEEIDCLGTWRANSNYCAWQVQAMLKKHYPRSVLRLDADAIVQSFPSLFVDSEFNPDIAAVLWKDSKLRPKGELLGGTMFFANNEKTQRIVDMWVEACRKTPLGRNSDLLQRIIRQNKHSINFQQLPLSYCKIFDSMKHQVTHTVIEHFQASRRFKATINQKRKTKSGIMDINSLASCVKSSTCIFLGSGRSINNISREGWETLKKFDLWAVNNWVYHPSIVPHFYHIEVKSYNYRIIQQRLAEKKEAYRKVKFIFPKGKTIKIKGEGIEPLCKIAPGHTLRFDYMLKSRDMGRTHSPFNADYKMDSLCLTKSYDMSITAIFELLYKLDYKRIILFGVDLLNSYYFWTGGNSMYGKVHHQTNKEHEGKNPNEPHNTFKVKDFMIDFHRRWMVPAGKQILVGNKDTALFPDLEYISLEKL